MLYTPPPSKKLMVGYISVPKILNPLSNTILQTFSYFIKTKIAATVEQKNSKLV